MSLCQFYQHSWLPTLQALGVLGYKGTMGLRCSRLVEERLLNLSGGPTLSSPYLLLFGFWITQCAQTVCTPNRIFAGPDLAFCILYSLSLSGGWTTLSIFALHALVEILHLASSLFRILHLVAILRLAKSRKNYSHKFCIFGNTWQFFSSLCRFRNKWTHVYKYVSHPVHV